MTQTCLFELEDYSPSLISLPVTRGEGHSSNGDVPSLLKWTGSKRSQATRIAAYAPKFEKYYEPFLGGGALLYLLARPGSIAADVYAPLICFWEMVRDQPKDLIDNYAEQWTKLQSDFPEYFYVVRNRFNISKQPEDLNFLMRTCVNGIVRFSKKGEFNNSFHLSRKGMLPTRFAKVVHSWTLRLREVEFRRGDFADTLADAKRGDFVYLDPPYAGNKQRYIKDLDNNRLVCTLEDLNRREVKWALSFDGARGETLYEYTIPKEIYCRKELLNSGFSAVSKVLNGPMEMVTESLYLNY